MSKGKFSDIKIEGARTNNLKNIDVKIPISKITCIYGPSGSGKTSLAFGTLVDESKRRYLNSLPNDIKFLWNIPPSADVDKIEPVLPVWALAQINPVVGSRPVVSDLIGATELLTRHYTLNGDFYCAECGGEIVKKSFEDFVNNWSRNLDDKEVIHFFIKKDAYKNLTPTGTPARSCKGKKSKIEDFNDDHAFWEVTRCRKKNISSALSRLEDFVGNSKIVFLIKVNGSQKNTEYEDSGSFCGDCSTPIFNSDFSSDKFNPLVATGACDECDGFGQTLDYDLTKIVKNETLTLDEGAIPLLTYKQFAHLMDDFKKDLKKKKINPELKFEKMSKAKWSILEKGGDNFCGLEEIYNYFERKKYKRSIRILSRRLKTERTCETCLGTRLRINKLSVYLSDLELSDALSSKINQIEATLKESSTDKDLSFKKLSFILETAKELGLGGVSLNRKVKTLSSGEYQRLLLVKILAQEGTGMLFVFDEPSRGLSIKEQGILYKKFEKLKAQGNTVAFVDHSRFLQSRSDYLIKMGLGAGSHGGDVVSVEKNKRKKITPAPKIVIPKLKSKSYVEFSEAKILDLFIKNIKVPLGNISWVIGDSGSGKSLFFKQLFYNHIELKHSGVKNFDLPYDFKRFHTTNVISKISYFDPELRTASSRSTVGTFLGFSELVRKHFSKLPVSEKLGLEPGCFSPNSDLGKCMTCEGRGILEIDMQFLENLTIKCEDCNGTKLKNDISTISDGTFTVDQSYNLPLKEVFETYKLTPKFAKLLEYTKLLNLSHLSLSRTLKSLSGGERLRLQFLKNLNLKATGEILIFDNLSIGLSGQELDGISSILKELKRMKNTVIIIDSNHYFSKIADNLIDFNDL
ncbi:MAG: hypothetical protein CME70_06845 [Halobacteriovorax sp.]|nr:hypothetical protein [Halobacteriovorax sp.]|tara:strand:+ start:481369 stop:483945 length:2577 start_codon:yes stop_codon:yes gene_type:complete